MLSPEFEWIFFPKIGNDISLQGILKPGQIFKEGNNLIFRADNLLVLKFLKEQNIEIDLIYIDPPYFAGSDEFIDVDLNSAHNSESSKSVSQFITFKKFAYANLVPPKDSDEMLKQCGFSQEEIEKGLGALNDDNECIIKAIFENADRKIVDFCNWFFYRVKLMKEILSKCGIIVVRFDYHYGNYARLVLDYVFGEDHFIGEFMVRRMEKNVSDKSRGRQKQLNVANDSLFVYFKEEKSNIFDYPKKKKDLVENEQSNPKLYNFLSEWLNPKNNVWMDIVGYEKRKKTFYPTENSVELLERIIETFSIEGANVADFFSGSGVTLSVASNKNRKWIGADIGEDSTIQSVRRLYNSNHRNFLWIRYLESENFTKMQKKENELFFYDELMTMEQLKRLIANDKDEREITIFTNSSIIEYSLVREKKIKIYHLFNNSENNTQAEQYIELPELTLDYSENKIHLTSYKIKDKRFSALQSVGSGNFEYLIEYFMILVPKGKSMWICKSAEFGKVMTTKKKREKPKLSIELSADMYIQQDIYKISSKPGIILEICDITGFKFKIFYTGGNEHAKSEWKCVKRQ